MTTPLRRTAAVAVALAGVGLAALTATGSLKPDETLTLAGVAAAATVAAAALWDSSWVRPVLGRVTSLKIASFQIDLDTLARKVEQATPQGTFEDPDPSDDLAQVTALDTLRLDLDKKLAYTVKTLLPANEAFATGHSAVPFATIGSLQYDGYLPADHALMAFRIQTLSPTDLEAIDAVARARFLDAARSVVRNVRFTIFSGIVRTGLTDRLGYTVTGLGDSQTAMLVSSPVAGTAPVVVWPSYAMKKDSTLADKAARKARDQVGSGIRTVVVVPNNSNLASLTRLDANPAVVKLEHLTSAVALQ